MSRDAANDRSFPLPQGWPGQHLPPEPCEPPTDPLPKPLDARRSVTADDARSLLYGHIEDALADGLTLDDVRQVAQEAHSSLLADRSFAKDEYDHNLYPHLAEDELTP